MRRDGGEIREIEMAELDHVGGGETTDTSTPPMPLANPIVSRSLQVSVEIVGDRERVIRPVDGRLGTRERDRSARPVHDVRARRARERHAVPRTGGEIDRVAAAGDGGCALVK